MSPPESLFRPEALESWARGRDRSGGVVRLEAPWRTRLYRLTLLLVLAGLVSLWFVRTQERVSGPAVIDRRTGSVAVLFPAASASELAGARELRVELPGDGRGWVPVAAVHARQADDAAVRQAGLRPLSQPGILLTGRLEAAVPRGSTAVIPANASVVLRSERLADLLVRQFDAALGLGKGPR